MRICIDARPLQKASRYRGIGTYISNLTENISLIDKGNSFSYLSLKNGIPLEQHEGTQFCEWLERPVWRPKRPERLHWLWDKMFLDKTLTDSCTDIFHASDITSLPSQLSARKYKFVITVHDMIPFLFTNSYMKEQPFDYQFALKHGLELLKEADAIITVSESTKRDVAKYAKIPNERIHVIYEGVSEDLLLIDRFESKAIIKRKYGISEDYVLYLGGVDYRKNIKKLIISFNNLLVNSDANFKLVLAGDVFTRKDNKDVKAVCALIEKLNMADNIKMPGLIDEKDLNALYGAANIFVFPSLYEGFGLPILEAMACGTPVITSNISSIPEVCGDAALLVDPNDVDSIAMAMHKVLYSNDMKGQMIRKGLERAKKFSWKMTAEETLAVYKEVYNNEDK